MTLLSRLRLGLPVLLLLGVVSLAMYGGDDGRVLAFAAGFVAYVIGFLALTTNNGEGDNEANAGVWLFNAFAIGGTFLVGLTALT